MADTNLTSVAGGLKRVYDKYIQSAQNLSAKASQEIGKASQNYNPGGEGYFGAINDYGNESGGAINEEESFRTIDAEDYQQWKVLPKVNVWPIQFSGLVAAAAQGGEESFANLVVDALDRARDRLLSDENRQFFGLGNGTLGAPAGAYTSTMTSITVNSVQYFRKNMVIDIYSGAVSTVSATRISFVDRVNAVIGLSAALGVNVDTTCQIVKQNIRNSAPSDGKEMMGLRGIVDDSTDLTTFQNLRCDSGQILEWRSRRINASSANLTSDLLQRLIDDVATLDPDGEEPDMLITHRLQRRKYLDLVVPQKRYADGDMDTGFKKLAFNGMELFLDKDCQADTVYAIRKDKIRKFELEPLGMGRHEGSDIFLRLVNQDVYQAYWRHYCNYGTSSRLSHGKIVSLAVPTGITG
jgi:hypothetical protein